MDPDDWWPFCCWLGGRQRESGHEWFCCDVVVPDPLGASVSCDTARPNTAAPPRITAVAAAANIAVGWLKRWCVVGTAVDMGSSSRDWFNDLVSKDTSAKTPFGTSGKCLPLAASRRALAWRHALGRRDHPPSRRLASGRCGPVGRRP